MEMLTVAIGRLAARTLIGALFIGHGTQKLFGWFDGPGPAGTTGMMSKLRLEPAKVNALAAGITETAGGTALVLGLATPLAAASLIGTMITAIRTVHLPNGPWVSKGGYEYNAVLIATLAILAEQGPGPFSLDAKLGIDEPGWKGALAALGLGAAVSTAVVEAGHRIADASPDASPSA